MSNVLATITRQPVLITGLVTSGLGLLVLFGVDLSKEQIGGIVLFLGAVMALITAIVTPSREVAVQVVKGEVVAGPAAIEPNGTNVTAGGDTGGEVVAAATIKPELLT